MRLRKTIAALGLVALAAGMLQSGISLAEEAPAPAAAPAPARPAITELEVFPERLDLSGVRDARRLLVAGKTVDGLKFDLTGEAQFAAAGAQIAIDPDGFITPNSNGATEVVVSAAGLELRVPVTVADATDHPVDFVRDVIPVISKVGCNAGTCHGSAKGKNGFKLSLRGYDPMFDYRALVDDISGRRFNRSRPEQSLMLLKPTQGVPHEGGFLFDEDSRYYKLIQQWIAQGCRYADSQRIDRIAVYPEKPLLQHETDRQQLTVLAFFADGTSRDVTRDAIYETSNFEVATVTQQGVVNGVRRGEAAALVRYEGRYAAAPITVIGSREGYKWVDSPEANFVDARVNDKLERMKLLPSELCTDAEFLRRAAIDLVGIPPTAADVRAFLADERPSHVKREAKLSEFLDSPGYVDHWTLKWSDLLLSNRKFIQEKGVWGFRNWIRNAVATNQPYNEFVYDLMTARGSTLQNPAGNYYRVAGEPRELMENMTQVFIGTRFQCNQCHDHPFERWTQQQYYQLSAFFSGVGRKQAGGEEIIYDLDSPQPIIHPGTGVAIPAAFPYSYEGAAHSETNLRHQLADWLTARENPYFAKSIVNRYWSYFLGRGIIDPVDDIRASNPPSNPELLEALTADFIDHDFDLKHLVRTIVSSNTYQRSFLTNEWNDKDEINFSHALPRRLAAEQLYDALITATGAPMNIPGMPPGFRATQLPDTQVEVSFLDMFGRPPRESPCECERTSEVSLAQTLNLINGPTVSESIAHPQGLIAGLVKEKADAPKLVEEVYLAVLCRFPTEEESDNAQSFLAEVGDNSQGTEDLMWALINSPAFLFNR